jgi:high-affinity iron transporter
LGASYSLAKASDWIEQSLDGRGLEVFNLLITGVAIVTMVAQILWVAKHSREIKDKIQQKSEAIRAGTQTMGVLAAILFAAIVREGAEIVLFLQSLAAEGLNTTSLHVGAWLGLGTGVGISLLLYRGLVQIPLRIFFRGISVLMAFISAGLAVNGLSLLGSVVELPWNSVPLYNVSAELPMHSWPGQILHTLLGYHDHPSLIQTLTYAITLCGIFTLMKQNSKETSK